MKTNDGPQNRVLIDTSAWIAGLRNEGPPEVRREVKTCLERSHATLAGMVALEVLRGAHSARAFDELESGFAHLERLTVDEFTWHEAGRLGWELRRKGVSVPAPDVLIAAVAIMNDCTLLHYDRHFEMIAEHAPLKTWMPAA